MFSEEPVAHMSVRGEFFQALRAVFYPGSLAFCLALLLGTAVWSLRRWLAFHHSYKLPEIKQSRKINFGSWWSPDSTALRPVTRQKHHGGKRRSRDAHIREGRPEL